MKVETFALYRSDKLGAGSWTLLMRIVSLARSTGSLVYWQILPSQEMFYTHLVGRGSSVGRNDPGLHEYLRISHGSKDLK